MVLKPVRWLVAGLGHFAQTAVLPAFAHADSAHLVGLASSEAIKRNALARRYHVETVGSTNDFPDLLRRSRAEAVYIAAPNHVHADLTIKAAAAGVHILCEKPMAPSQAECRKMIAAAKSAKVKLMIAYRLHFEAANMAVVDAVARGRIGDPRSMIASFTFQLRAGNVRALATAAGGGPLWDIGVYCVNAARYVFKDEPIRVVACTTTPGRGRFAAIDEQASVVLLFSRGRMAIFNVGFGAATTSWYEVVGTRGSLRLDPGFHQAQALRLRFRNAKGELGRPRDFRAVDQVAAELEAFSACVRDDRMPEPSGREGLADVRIIEAALASVKSGRAFHLATFTKRARPGGHQVKRVPRPRKAVPLINVAAPKR